MILCVGTTPTVQRTMAFNHLKLNEVNRAVQVHEGASGKSVNVARVLHAMGQEVLETGFIGGESGKFLRHDLDREGINHSFINVNSRTRTCTTILDRATGMTTELVEEAGEVEEKAWRELVKLIDSTLWRAKVLVLSGSLAPGVPVDFYAQCVELAAKAKVPVILDGRGEAMKLALAHKPLIVKPNRAELAETVGKSLESEEEFREAIRQVVLLGAQWVVVTMGAEGAMISNGEKFWRLHVPKVKTINPIGSGDSLTAGLAAGIGMGEEMPGVCVLGGACGAANAMTFLPGFVRVNDVKNLRAEVRMEELS